MEKLIISQKMLFDKMIITIILIALLFSANLNAQENNVVLTVMALGPDQYSDIQYQSIEVDQVVDFSNIISVYINKASVIMVDLKPVAFDNTGETVKKILITNMENKYGTLNPETIVDAKNDFKILIRKSAFTNKDDYKTLMKKIDNTIWGLQKHYSYEVYGAEYKSLSQKQKNNINKLVPLQNFLAKDNTE